MNESNGWISVKDALPKDNETVLAVKQLRNGTKDICIARCMHGYKYYDRETNGYWIGTYWTCGGNNNIIFWMPLPAMPERGEKT